MTSLDATFVRCAGLLSVDVDGEAVILDVESGSYFSLGDTGADIWSRLAQPIQGSVLSEQLALDYVGDPEIMRQDVVELLDTLLERKLIRLV